MAEKQEIVIDNEFVLACAKLNCEYCASGLELDDKFFHYKKIEKDGKSWTEKIFCSAKNLYKNHYNKQN